MLILALKRVIYKQAGAADKELPVILDPCEKKGLCPWAAGTPVPVLAPQAAAARGGAEHPLGSQEGPDVPQFPMGRRLVSFSWLILVRSNEEGLEIIIPKPNK